MAAHPGQGRVFRTLITLLPLLASPSPTPLRPFTMKSNGVPLRLRRIVRCPSSSALPSASHEYEEGLDGPEGEWQKLRFGGIERLYGPLGLKAFRDARVAVIGIGGVGSWAVEALARSGVGSLTLVDLDDICVSNVNRQLHALSTTVGRYLCVCD